MSIYVNGTKTLFLLSTDATSYAMEVGATGRLQHLYWGARLERPEDLPLGRQLQYYPFDEPDKKLITNQEYWGWGGYLFDEPCLKVLFADGCRDLDLRFASCATAREGVAETLTITLREQVYPLEVDLCYRLYDGLEVIDRWAVVRNTGDEPVLLEDVQSGTLYPPRGKEYRLTHLSGKWAAEYALERVTLTQSKTVVESRNGVSGPDSCPWVAVDYRGEATEHAGRVWACSLHWPGNWKLVAEVNRVEQVRITGGINDFDFSWKLGPGDSFEAPVLTAVYSEAGFGGASRAFHRYQLDYLMPREKAKALRPVIFNSWEVFEFDINVEQQMELAKLAAGVGAELYVVDDGWFGSRDSDRAGLGDWFPSPSKFPQGLTPLIEHVNALGMDFGIWVEPEMVNADSELYRAHPEWVIRFPGKECSQWRNQLTLNFAREDVKEWAWSFLDALLGNHNIQYLKWDMNRYLSEPGWPEKPVDQQREIWTRYARNVLEVYERIQQKYPHVLLENCASGGARIDLSMAAVSDMVNSSDNGDPLDNLKIFEGYTQAFLPKTMGGGISVTPNFINNRTTPMAYRAHMGMMGTFFVGDNLFNYSQEELAEAAEHVCLCKALRETAQNGDLYRLVSAYDRPYAVYSFVRRDQSDAVVFAFGQSLQFRRPIPRVRLLGLDPDALYEVDGLRPTGPYDHMHLEPRPEHRGPWAEEVQRMSGRGLMNIGVELDLTGDFDSQVIHLRKV